MNAKFATRDSTPTVPYYIVLATQPTSSSIPTPHYWTESLLTSGSPPPRNRCPELHYHFETTGRGFEIKSVQVSPTAPRRILLEGNTSHRLCRDSWREKSKRLEEQLPTDLQKRLPLQQIKELLRQTTLGSLHHPSRKEQKLRRERLNDQHHQQLWC